MLVCNHGDVMGDLVVDGQVVDDVMFESMISLVCGFIMFPPHCLFAVPFQQMHRFFGGV